MTSAKPISARVYLNGRFVPAARAWVSVLDRGFLYGDGLFETIRVHLGRPFRWRQHLARLQHGAAFLGIRLPRSAAGEARDLTVAAAKLLSVNRVEEGLLRVAVSRGIGDRGYCAAGAHEPTLVMTTHLLTAPKEQRRPLRLVTVQGLGVPTPLAQVKSANKLPQVLACTRARALGADEAIMVDARGFITEAASANIFWVKAGSLFTTPADAAVLPGITRAAVLEVCSSLGITVAEQRIRPKALAETDGVFLTFSSAGVVEAGAIDGGRLKRSSLVRRIRNAYDSLLARESQNPEW